MCFTAKTKLFFNSEFSFEIVWKQGNLLIYDFVEFYGMKKIDHTLTLTFANAF
jgi:hypothetical protein